ncbi:hypothetical protein ACFLSE_01010 [Bacteroidota bacterium]
MIMFEYHETKSKAGIWNIVKVNLDPKSDLILRAARQAKLKVKHTIQAGQDGRVRNNNLKFQNQFRGMIAEIYALELLKSWLAKYKLHNCEVVRYDDVRTDDFSSPENEYDLKIQRNGSDSKVIKIESRSSVTYKRTLTEGINDLDIIGPYISKSKSKESYVDHYIRPLFDNTKEMKAEEFSDFLKNGLIDLYFVAGCSKEHMIEKGFYKSMKQSSTRYRCLPITSGLNILEFQSEIIKSLM